MNYQEVKNKDMYVWDEIGVKFRCRTTEELRTQTDQVMFNIILDSVKRGIHDIICRENLR